MSDEELPTEPWADVSLPRDYDARSIYEYATSVGEARRQQRKQRQTVLTALSCVLVALSALAIVLSRSDEQTSVSVAGAPPTEAGHVETPHATSPPVTQNEARRERVKRRVRPATPPAETTPSVPVPRRRASMCRVRPIATHTNEIELVAFHGQVVGTTTTTLAPPPTTTTTVPPPPPPPRTTTTVKRPKPPRSTTTIVVSPDPPVSIPPPLAVDGVDPPTPRPRSC